MTWNSIEMEIYKVIISFLWINVGRLPFARLPAGVYLNCKNKVFFKLFSIAITLSATSLVWYNSIKKVTADNIDSVRVQYAKSFSLYE